MMISGVWRMMAAVVCSVTWASAAAGQGLYWESKITGAGEGVRTTQTYAMPKMMKIVDADGQVVILRADQEKFITVDMKQQTYHEIGFAEMESAATSMAAQMQAARGELEKQMKSMPPAQREMMEKALSQMGGTAPAAPAAVVIKNTGETKTIGGYTCTKYVATESGKTVLVAWTTDLEAFAGLRGDWLALQKRLAGTSRAFGGGIADAYAKIEGFPMATEMDDFKSEVIKVEPRTIPASEFDVPAGYKKQSMKLPQPAKR